MIERKKELVVAIAGFVSLMLGGSCEKVEITRSEEREEVIENVDGKSGVSLEMESDSLLDDIENLNLDAEEWGEEGMDVDL